MKILYSDNRIVADLKNKDESITNSALRYLYKSYYKMALHYIIKNSGDEDEAADVFQDVIIVFYESVIKNKFRGDSTIKTFLYSTIRNTWLTRLKKNKQKMTLEPDSVILRNLKATEKTGTGEELNKIVAYILEQIGESCKKILKYYYYENLSMKEIMSLMGFVNVNSAKTQKYKCMKKIIRLFELKPELKEKILNEI